jgi:hypothetical protein
VEKNNEKAKDIPLVMERWKYYRLTVWLERRKDHERIIDYERDTRNKVEKL